MKQAKPSRRPWLAFERHGGSEPRDDESLSLAEDGSFIAHRTIGGPCIGSFAGTLPARTMTRLRTAAAALDDAADLDVPTPRHGATETLSVEGATFRAGSNHVPPKPWAALVKAVRGLFEDAVIDHTRAAVCLAADARSARLEHRGAAPIDVDLGSMRVRVVHMTRDGAVRAQWVGRPEGTLVANGETMMPTPRWLTAGPGWTSQLPFDHRLELGSGEWLQVWVDVPIREDQDARSGRLYVPVIADG